MISRTADGFWKLYAALPEQVKRQARVAYERFQSDPHHPSLQFKPVHQTEPVYSARISRDYRAVGLRNGAEIVWFWIGSHGNFQ